MKELLKKHGMLIGGIAVAAIISVVIYKKMEAKKKMVAKTTPTKATPAAVAAPTKPV